MQRFSQSIADGNCIDIEKYENLKTDLCEYENEKCTGAILRSKAQWANESDKCTKYFLNLEKSRQESNTVKELLDEKGEVKKNADFILDMQYNFHSNLYSCVTIECESKNQLLSLVDTKLNESDVELCDKNIDVKEIEQALKEMASNKSPGPDGLTVEFYKRFLPQFKNVLYKLFFRNRRKRNIVTFYENGCHYIIIQKER